MKQYKPIIHTARVGRNLLFANVVMSLLYLSWWFNPHQIASLPLYILLFLGEIYHVGMSLLFWHTIWPRKQQRPLLPTSSYSPKVDVYITVCGEPKEIVRETALAAKNMNYRNHKVYILNDGYIAKKDNWKDMEDLAKELRIICITRKQPGGAKAGNINRAVEQTKGEYILIFDADMVPHRDFLSTVMPHFTDERVGFVQTPQYYRNYSENVVTHGAWEQQEFFFGPIMRGKDTQNSAFICGTNVVLRRSALIEAGGMREDNIAEDFLTSLSIHQLGWKSLYIPDVLAEGMAPQDFLSYYKQQFRWARGSLEVLFSENPLLKKNLKLSQKLEYISSALYYTNGVVFIIDIIMPLIFLYTGIKPVAATTTSFAFFFLPFMLLNLYTLFIVSKQQLTFRAISFSQASFTLQLSALKSILLKEKVSFSVTPKQAQSGNFLWLVAPHITYIALTIVGIIIAYTREGMNPSIATNIAWAVLPCIMFIPFIQASYDWQPIMNKLTGWLPHIPFITYGREAQ